MTSHRSRLAKLETVRLPRPHTAMERAEWAAFWEQRLGSITDKQLDRLEALMIKMGLESGDPKDEEERDIRDMVHALSDLERAELRAIFGVIGIEEDW